ncbi:MAG TPA: hypothetical protein VH142_05855 [Polyangiaceae bacterium]|nr:hypothetical protein [Polyangiaceae bacterium]
MARRFLSLTLGLISLSAALAGTAHAEGSQASSTGKGVTGGALLGGEAVMLVEAAAGTRPGWAYAVGGGLGAIAGGVGGYFPEHDHDTKLSFYLLVGGMALVIPTTVAVLSATAYTPTDYTEDRPSPDEPIAQPAAPLPATTPAPTPEPAPAAAPAPAPAAPAPAAAPSGRARDRVGSPVARRQQVAPALVGIADGSLTLSVPAVEVRQMYTRTEIALYGVKQHTEVEVPVLNLAF